MVIMSIEWGDINEKYLQILDSPPLWLKPFSNNSGFWHLDLDSEVPYCSEIDTVKYI